MARLIKKGEAPQAMSDEGSQSVTQALVDPSGTSQQKRTGIIDRDTFEARSEAQQIRERAQAQADEILTEAQKKADQMGETARAQAESLRQEAHKAGLKTGHDEGLKALMAAVAQNNQRARGLEAEVVPQLKALALGIARRILGKELEYHPEGVVEIARQVLKEKARQRREITLRVHPDDMTVIRESKAMLIEGLSRCKDIALQEDQHVARHGVIVETEAGIIDAQLDTQLAALESVLDAMD